MVNAYTALLALRWDVLTATGFTTALVVKLVEQKVCGECKSSSTFIFLFNPKWVWCFQAEKSILGKLTAPPKASILLVTGFVSLTAEFD